MNKIGLLVASLAFGGCVKGEDPDAVATEAVITTLNDLDTYQKPLEAFAGLHPYENHGETAAEMLTAAFAIRDCLRDRQEASENAFREVKDNFASEKFDVGGYYHGGTYHFDCNNPKNYVAFQSSWMDSFDDAAGDSVMVIPFAVTLHELGHAVVHEESNTLHLPYHHNWQGPIAPNVLEVIGAAVDPIRLEEYRLRSNALAIANSKDDTEEEQIGRLVYSLFDREDSPTVSGTTGWLAANSSDWYEVYLSKAAENEFPPIDVLAFNAWLKVSVAPLVCAQRVAYVQEIVESRGYTLKEVDQGDLSERCSP